MNNRSLINTTPSALNKVASRLLIVRAALPSSAEEGSLLVRQMFHDGGAGCVKYVNALKRGRPRAKGVALALFVQSRPRVNAEFIDSIEDGNVLPQGSQCP